MGRWAQGPGAEVEQAQRWETESASCLYGGASEGAWVYGPPEAALLVLGPPRSGKTAALVVPNVIRAAGAVVVTSTKADVLSASLVARARLGRCWVFDPSATMDIPPGAEALCWSPVSGCGDWEAALSRAHALARASRPGRGLMEATHWVERAEALLGPLLHAAALGDLTLEAVVHWVLRREVVEAVALLGDGSLAADTLAGIDATDERERSGIFSTAASILSAYRSTAALAAASAPNFCPAAFVHSADTVYVCAPAHAQDQLAPLVVALLDEIRTAAYARGRVGAPVLFALDEVANIAPLPGLPALVAEGGSQGVLTLACLQDLSQARARWGEAASGFLSLFGAKVVLAGIADHATLALVSELCGEHDVAVYSDSWARWPVLGSGARATRSVSTVRRRRLPVDELATGRPGCGIWIVGGSPPGWVDLTPWYECSPWREVAAGQAPGQQVPPRRRGRRPARADWRVWAVAGVVLGGLTGAPHAWWPLVALGLWGAWVWRRMRGVGRAGAGAGRRRWRAWVWPVVVAVTVLPVSWWPVAVLAVAAMLGWLAWASGRPGARGRGQ